MILTDYSGDRLKALNSSQTLDSNYQLVNVQEMAAFQLKNLIKSCRDQHIPMSTNRKR